VTFTRLTAWGAAKRVIDRIVIFVSHNGSQPNWEMAVSVGDQTTQKQIQNENMRE